MPEAAFSLVELLVVIGIIGLLLAILLPVLSTARNSARNTLCASNLKQQGELAQIWASGHNYWLPLDGVVSIPQVFGYGSLPEALHDGHRRRYAYTLDDGSYPTSNAPPTLESPTPYGVAILQMAVEDGSGEVVTPSLYWTREIDATVRLTELFHCPSATRSAQWESLHIQDGMSSLVLQIGKTGRFSPWWTSSDYATNGGLLGFHHDRAFNHKYLRGHLTAIASPSMMVLSADGDGDFMSWVPRKESTAAVVTLEDVRSRTAHIDLMASRLPLMDPSRHGGAVTVAFADGHVVRIRATEKEFESAQLVQALE